jgi:hypothetical protein
MWALKVAKQLGDRIAVIDTENESATLYVGVDGLEFDTCNLDTFEIQRYLDAIAAAQRGGFDVIIIDSLSHAWAGEGGALEQVDKLKGNNAFTNGWGVVTPLQNKLMNAITQCKVHIICTLQQHQEIVLEPDSRGKMVPVRKGLAAVQRKGMEYLFSVYGEIDLADHGMNVTKSRLWTIKNGKYSKDNLDLFAQTIRDFHESGDMPTPAEPEHPAAPSMAPASRPQQPTSRPQASAPAQPPSPPPANTQAPQQPLPATLAKTYPDKALAGMPFKSIQLADLEKIVIRYKEKLKDATLAAPHRENCRGQLAAAEAEMKAKLALIGEMAAEEPGDDQSAEVIEPSTGQVYTGGAPLDPFPGAAASAD